jgi:hypothetical protein
VIQIKGQNVKKRDRLRPGQNAVAAEKSRSSPSSAAGGAAEQSTRGSPAPAAVITPGEIVRAFYRVLLLREPDPSGFDGYVRELQGGRPVEHFLRALLKTKEFAGVHKRFLATYVSVAPAQQNIAKTAPTGSAISQPGQGTAQKTQLPSAGAPIAPPDAKR